MQVSPPPLEDMVVLIQSVYTGKNRSVDILVECHGLLGDDDGVLLTGYHGVEPLAVGPPTPGVPHHRAHQGATLGHL